MKSLIKLLFCSLFLSAILFSCKKDEKQVTFNGGTAPVLSADQTASISLSYLTKDNEAVNLSWTNPQYQFTTGISSLDVSYLLEIDTTGANFTNPARQQFSIGKDLSKSFNQNDFNDFLLNQLQLTPGVSHNIEIRVTSTLGNSATALVSNVLKYAVVPYAIPPKVAPPASGHLYLVGSATAGGWNNPVPVPSQEFTQISPTLYQLDHFPLIGGQQYLFIPVNGDWSHKYACHASSTVSSGGDFGYDWNDNFPGPTAGGNYKIVVDFQRGKFSVTPQ